MTSMCYDTMDYNVPLTVSAGMKCGSLVECDL
jgi:hypothetical protein